MKLYSRASLSEETPCPYIQGQRSRSQFFFASDLNERELEFYLEKGFRKFGLYFFRPQCLDCKACTPLRVLVNEFKLSKGQKRVIKKNADLKVSYSSLAYKEEYFELYKKHSKERFNDSIEKIGTPEDFIQSHFTPSTPSMLSKFYLEDKLVALGFLDIAHHGISSVYFIYDPDHSHRSLGTYGALKEIELTKELNKSYYYLGYWIKENQSMNYKANFKVHELYNWKKEVWEKA